MLKKISERELKRLEFNPKFILRDDTRPSLRRRVTTINLSPRGRGAPLTLVETRQRERFMSALDSLGKTKKTKSCGLDPVALYPSRATSSLTERTHKTAL